MLLLGCGLGVLPQWAEAVAPVNSAASVAPAATTASPAASAPKAPVAATTFRLANGDVLTAMVLAEDATTWTLAHPVLGQLVLPKASASREAPPPAAAATAAAAPAAPKPAATATAPKSAGSGASPAPANRRLPGEQVADAISRTRFWRALVWVWPFKGWDNRLNLGLRWIVGSPDRQEVNLRYEGNQKDKRGEQRVSLQYDYANETRSGREFSVTERLQTAYRFRRDLNPRIYWQSDSRYTRDQVRQFDHDLRQSFGIGWRFWDQSKKSGNFTPGIEGRGLDDGSTFAWDLAVTLQQDWNIALTGWMRWVEEARVSFAVTDFGEYSAEWNHRFETKLTDRMTADVRLEFDYESVVASGLENLQQRLLLTLGWRF